MVQTRSVFVLALGALLFKSATSAQDVAQVEYPAPRYWCGTGVLDVDIFKPGSLKVVKFSLAANGTCSQLGQSPCKATTIFAPKQEGDYPVVLFQHGYELQVSYYTQLLTHLASFGFVIVAPQMYDPALAGLPLYTGNATQEISDAVAMLRWSQTYLNGALASKVKKVTGNADQAALAGHSRGGKVAAGVAIHSKTSEGAGSKYPPVQAVALVDPVDGTAQPVQTQPELRFCCSQEGCPSPPHLTEQQFTVGAPLLLVGTALGRDRKKYLGIPTCPCAPIQLGFEAFYNQSSDEKYNFVATDYGHLDMLDDNTKGMWWNVALQACVEGEPREAMREFTAGALVAFFGAKVLHNDTYIAKFQNLAYTARINITSPFDL